MNWNLPEQLVSYGEWLSEKFGQHDVPAARIANMSSLKEIYDKMKFYEVWNLLEKVSR